MREYGLDERRAEMLVAEPGLAVFFEEAESELEELSRVDGRGTLFNYLTSDLRGLMNDAGVGLKDLKVSPEHLAHLVSLIIAGKITSRQAKDVLAKMFATGADPEDIVAQENIGISSDTAEIEAVVTAVIAENEVAVNDYRKGKTASMQFLIGKAMGKLKGRARPDMLTDLFRRMLG